MTGSTPLMPALLLWVLIYKEGRITTYSIVTLFSQSYMALRDFRDEVYLIGMHISLLLFLTHISLGWNACLYLFI